MRAVVSSWVRRQLWPDQVSDLSTREGRETQQARTTGFAGPAGARRFSSVSP